MFPTQAADGKSERMLTLRELAAEIRMNRAADKGRLPWYKLARFGDQRTEKNSLRHDANVLGITGIEIDHDGGGLSVADGLDRLRQHGVAAMLYTSPSHLQPGKGERWRVFIPLSAEIPPSERKTLCRRVNGIFEGRVDQVLFTLSQSYYGGNIHGGTPVEAHFVEGDFLDQLPQLESIALDKRKKQITPQGLDDLLGELVTDEQSDAAVLARISAGDGHYHDRIKQMAGRYASRDLSMLEARARLDKAMRAVSADAQNAYWRDQLAGIDSLLEHAYSNQAKKVDASILSTFQDVEEGEGGDGAEISDLNGFDLSENGLVSAFATKYRKALRFDHDLGKWFVWSGRRWERNNTQLAHEYARQLSVKVARTDPKSATVKPLKRVSTWEAIERGARRVAPLATNSAIWDADPWLLGTPGGTVDLRTGDLHDARQSDFITKQTAVTPIPLSEFNPSQHCPTWIAFLDFATGEDAGAVRFLQQWLGYSLTGDTREQALLFVHGPGGSGKGTAINGFADVMGDYSLNVDMSTLTAAKYEGHTTQFARLRGARMARASETEEGKAWAENRIKTLTGGDKVTARFMRQDDFEFVPEFKLTIFGNNRPAIANVDEAIKRRFNVLPFTRIPPVKDLQLGAKLRAEWSGMLSWAILGCLDWQANGLVRPHAVLDATASYFEEQDTFQLWIDAECEVGRQHADTTDRLWESWMSYAREVGEPCGSRNKTFPEMMQRRGYSLIKNKQGIRGRGFAGITVRTHDDMFEEGE
ncbi:phage/plasmid primase, P4 family [Corticibacterium sp. UT-5YL-CI-8]|nr:phage/plasmid primase, P4 family [Tianweitania sp. UT-5YL-CI-8]